MKEKIIAAVLSATMLTPAVVQIKASAEQTMENNSVSGYISLTDGVKIAGADKTPSIYVDKSDYEGVLLAAQNMKTDLETVTGKKVKTNNFTGGSFDVKITSLNQSEKTMTVFDYDKLTTTGRGIVAVYDGTLSGVYMSENLADNENGTLTFAELPDFTDKDVYAYLWEDKNGLTCKPLADKFEYGLPSDASEYDIIVGTLGQSETINALAEADTIDVSEIEGKWESFTVQKNGNQIIIAGSDKRGTIYGIYDFCEKIGVSAWAWWADATPVTAEELYVNLPDGGYTEGEPSVKYRGIFLNDEFNFNQWSKALSADGNTNMSSEAYSRVFELVLRLKANTVWPAMHQYSNCFHADVKNAETAGKYGVVIGSSHAEPLLRNNLGELDAFQDKWEQENPTKKLYKALENESKKKVAYYWTDHDNENNAVDNKEFLEAYWRESVQKYGTYENIYTLGMRGVHDGSFQTNMDYATALNEIVATQRKILKEEVADKQGISLEDIPQVFIPYKDIQPLYNKGDLNIPDDVTIMWTDDNYGYVRQNANDAERERAGRTGIYYHVSYYGYPTSYLWLSTTQPGLIREEMSKSYNMGADRMWILNVGDLKPAEKEIEYFTRLARNVEKTNSEDISDIYSSNAKRDFNMNDTDAAEYADIMDKFYEIANSKRPDFFRTNDADSNLEISMTAYGDEAERYINSYNDITKRVEALYDKLPQSKKASFFELALYPIRSSRNMAVNYIQTARANLYAAQLRGTASERYAKEAAEASKQITEDINHYNTMLNGKWNNMTNINPSKLQGCDAHITLDLNASTLKSLDYASLAVMTDSQTEYSDNPSMTVSAYDSYDKFIDVINQGYGSFDYTVTADTDALVFDKTSGTAYGSDRVHVSVDKSKAPAGISQAKITVAEKLENTVVDSKEIAVTIENPDETITEKTYVEAGGVVSIEAENYTDIKSNGVYEWKLEKDFGRSNGSMKAYPDNAANANESTLTTSAAYMEYKVYFANAGTYTCDVYRMPTLNERNNMKFAVSVDSGNASVLSGTSAYPLSSSDTRNKSNRWSSGVLTNSEKLSTTVTVPTAGYHTLRVYNVSSGVVIDKMVLHKDSVNSYFGAPESYNSTYNTEKLTTAVSNEEAPTNEVKKTYEPKAVVSGVTKNDNTISGVELYRLSNDIDSAVVITAGYDEDGNVTAKGLAKAEFSDTTVTVPVNMTLTNNTVAYAVYVVDNLTDMKPIAPYKVYGKITSETDGNYISLKSDLSDYYGKKSVVLIADSEIADSMSVDNIVYVYGEAIDRDSYKFMPFSSEEGVYRIRVGIDGAETVNETKNTQINIRPDNEGVSTMLNEWDFANGANDKNGLNPFTVSGGASIADGVIKTNSASSGTATMTYPKSVVAAQGESVTVEFDINFGRQDGKTTNYAILDSSGNNLVSMTVCAYNPQATNTNLKIGNTNVLDDVAKLSGAMSRSKNTPKENSATHFKNVIDFSTGRVTVTVSSAGKETAEFTGKLADNNGNIGSITFGSNIAIADRTNHIDNVKVSKVSGPQYKMTFKAVDSVSEEEIANAAVTVKDGSSNAVIPPEADGTYMLCEGEYIVSVSANGYVKKEQRLELIPALESKEVKVPMMSAANMKKANITIEFKDSDGGTVMDSITPDGDFYVGGSYSVDEKYQKDLSVKADGKTYLYKYMPERSDFTTDSLSEDNTFTMVYNMDSTYDVYEDFEEYDIDSHVWNKGAKNPKTLEIANDNDEHGKYLKLTVANSSAGAWTPINPAIDCEGKMVTIDADIRFAPTGTTGLAQFSIGSSSPAFSSNNIDYGMEGCAGHILAFEYNQNDVLKFNGQTVTGFAGDWMHMTAKADFVTNKIDLELTNKSGNKVNIEGVNFFNNNQVSEIGSVYLRGAGANGSVSLDNLTMLVRQSTSEPVIPDSPLYRKSVYAFGDSIVKGHNTPTESFMQIIANDYGINLNMLAVNGATVINSSNWITKQVNNAPAAEPDIVVFDGYTNDAYESVLSNMGTMQGSSASAFDNTTFCGAFEELIYTMKHKWPNAKLVFITIHKSGGRDFDIQTELVEKTLAMCEEWGVEVVDMFNDCTLDTRNADEMKNYIINGAGSHPNLKCVKEFYEPIVAAKLEELVSGN